MDLSDQLQGHEPPLYPLAHGSSTRSSSGASRARESVGNDLLLKECTLVKKIVFSSRNVIATTVDRVMVKMISTLSVITFLAW
jgi:hypothetical protein